MITKHADKITDLHPIDSLPFVTPRKGRRSRSHWPADFDQSDYCEGFHEGQLWALALARHHAQHNPEGPWNLLSSIIQEATGVEKIPRQLAGMLWELGAMAGACAKHLDLAAYESSLRERHAIDQAQVADALRQEKARRDAQLARAREAKAAKRRTGTATRSTKRATA